MIAAAREAIERAAGALHDIFAAPSGSLRLLDRFVGAHAAEAKAG